MVDAVRDDRRAADRLLLRASRVAGPWLWLLSLNAVVLAVVETALPAVLGRATDALVLDGVAWSWVTLSAVLVTLLVISDAVDDLAVGFTHARSTSWLRHSVLFHVLRLEPRTAATYDGGDLATRLVGNCADAGRVAPQLVRVTVNLVPGVGSIVALALIDPWLAATFLLGLPVLLGLGRVLTRQATDASEHYLRAQGTIAARLLEALAGIRTIAAAGTVGRETNRVLAPLPELRRHGLAMWQVLGRMSVQQALVVPLLQLAVLAVAGALLAQGRITPGQLLAALLYAELGSRLGALEPLVQIARSRAGAGRVAEVLAEAPLRYGVAGLPANGGGHLELRGVTVRVGDRPVLDRVDLDVPAGALIGIVGLTGAGKSVLAGLCSRLQDPDEGEVRLDGVPLPQLGRSELRRAIGFVASQPVLIGDTIRDAIEFGSEAPAPDAVAAASSAAQADGFISRMPAGYGTALVDAPMSAGELQRMGLARTFAHAERVLVLDDVAASLDTVTDQLIRHVLTTQLAGRTRILVARRASTARAVDTVVWLDTGRLRGLAPHEDLWHDPDYRAIFEGGGPVGSGCHGQPLAGMDGSRP